MQTKQLRKILLVGGDLPDFIDLYISDKRINYLFNEVGNINKDYLTGQLSKRLVHICRDELNTYEHKNLKVLAELITILDCILLD